MYQITWINKKRAVQSITSPSWTSAWTAYIAMKVAGVSSVRLWNPDRTMVLDC